ncbi:MAG: hypothetical protein ACK4MS_10540 [Paracoccaceae bacterium]
MIRQIKDLLAWLARPAQIADRQTRRLARHDYDAAARSLHPMKGIPDDRPPSHD